MITDALTKSSGLSQQLRRSGRVRQRDDASADGHVLPRRHRLLLLVGWTDDGTAFDFGAEPVSLQDSNNCSLSGSVVGCSGSGNRSSDGFAVRFSGTFGPSHPLSFDYRNTTRTFQSVTFAVAVPNPAAANDSPPRHRAPR